MDDEPDGPKDRHAQVHPSDTLAHANWNAGSSFRGDHILPRDLASRIESHGTADNHRAAAPLYQKRARQLAAVAAQYGREAEDLSFLRIQKGSGRASEGDRGVATEIS